MNKVKKINFKQRLAAIILSVILVLSIAPAFSLIPTAPFNAFGYETGGTADFKPTELGIDNPQFANSSGALPAAPTGWTKTSFANKKEGSTAMGVLDLNAYNTTRENREAAKLDEYPEYRSATPVSPFGSKQLIGAKDGNDKILMVNTTKSTETVIGYKSSQISLSANKFFKISAWIKTGEFYGQYGAAIRLNGIPNKNLAFSDIKTVSKDTELNEGNLFGWVEYVFYIKTSSIRSESVSLALTVGDFYEGTDKIGNEVVIDQNASGYAFFDNIQALEISPTMYNSITNNDGENSKNVKIEDLSLNAARTDTNLSFEPDEDGMFNHFSLFTFADTGVEASDIVQPAVLNTELSFDTDNNPYNLESEPFSPFGKGSGDSNILIVSSYKEGKNLQAKYKETAAGYVSDPITIKKFQYYRLSVWVNTDRVNGGAGAALTVTTDQESSTEKGEMVKFTATGLTGNNSDASRYGWSEQAYYIKGSITRDYDITLGMFLGQEGSRSSGTVMFGGIRFEELTGTEYTANSSFSVGGNPVSIDASVSAPSITNGNFTDFEEPSIEGKFPLPVAAWTMNTPDTVFLGGYSQDINSIEKDAIISGIMPTDAVHYAEHRGDYGAGAGAVPPLNESGFVLYMASPVLNAFNYTSPAIDLGADSFNKITVNLKVDNVADGYGASLVLKDENGIVATIENITDTDGFYDYSFYIENGADAHSLTLEIWLGLNERGAYNINKLSKGNLYVKSVSMTAVEQADFATAMNNYKKDLSLAAVNPTAPAFSYKTVSFTEFDSYDKNFVKFPYIWSLSGPSDATAAGVKAGIFNSTHIPRDLDGNITIGDIPPRFENPSPVGSKTGPLNENILFLSQNNKTASSLSLNRLWNLSAGVYYKLDVLFKADIYGDENKETQKNAGASIELKGTEYKFENILSTVTDKTRPEDFKSYTFYLYPGETAQSVGLAFNLGAAEVENYASGNLYIAGVALTEVNEDLFNDETKKINKDTDNVLKVMFDKSATVETPEEPEGADGAVDWMLISSIIFPVILLIALAFIIGRRVRDNIRNKRAKQGAAAAATSQTADYDRETTLHKGLKDYSAKQSGDGAVLDEKTTTDAEDQQSYEMFDDRLPEKKDDEPEKAVRKQTSVTDSEKADRTEKPEKPKNDFDDSFDD